RTSARSRRSSRRSAGSCRCTAPRPGRCSSRWGRRTNFRRVAVAGLARWIPRTIVAPGRLRQELARAAESGYGVNHEEYEVGVSAVAAPVFDARRRVLAALSITGNAAKLDLDRG